MRTFPASFPHTIWFFSDYFLFFSHGLCQFWEHSVDENLPCILSPYYLIFFWLFFVFFSRFLPVLRTICRWEPSLHPFQILFVFFSDYFLFFSHGFCQFWERSVDENLPCILSPYHLFFFSDYFFAFFLRFLPVLRTICRWEPSLHPFPILFDFFLIIFWVLILSSLFFVFWFSIESSILELSGLYALIIQGIYCQAQLLEFLASWLTSPTLSGGSCFFQSDTIRILVVQQDCWAWKPKAFLQLRRAYPKLPRPFRVP